ncbi:CPCC family cysteine-rich protein [Brevundimonas sp.]|uniref:CPCC family cysteine-rich protein n=1 Tax=Brevundimonas sp. TaxID=1871086 RepID=UPI003F6F2491
MRLGEGATCACCGYRTLPEGGAGGYEVCPVCWWEDDPVQMASPLLRGGANAVSLAEAQLYFISSGFSDPRFTARVRAPTEAEAPDPAWRPWESRRDLAGALPPGAASDYLHAAGAEPGAPYWLKS